MIIKDFDSLFSNFYLIIILFEMISKLIFSRNKDSINISSMNYKIFLKIYLY